MKKKKTDRTRRKPGRRPPAPGAAPEPPTLNGVEVLHVTTLDELQAACETTIHVKLLLPGARGVQIAMVPVRLLRPNETEKLELILKEVQPPLKEVLQPDGRKEMHYVPDKDTLDKAAKLQRVARAMALWWTCSLFGASDAGKKIVEAGEKREEVTEFVQSKFTDPILQKLYDVVRSEEFHLEDRVNFITPPS